METRPHRGVRPLRAVRPRTPESGVVNPLRYQRLSDKNTRSKGRNRGEHHRDYLVGVFLGRFCAERPAAERARGTETSAGWRRPSPWTGQWAGPTSGRPHSQVSVVGLGTVDPFQTKTGVTSPLNGRSGRPVAREVICPAGELAKPVVPVGPRAAVPVHVRVKETPASAPLATFFETPAAASCTVNWFAARAVHATGSENVRVSSPTEASKDALVTEGPPSAGGNGKDVLA